MIVAVRHGTTDSNLPGQEKLRAWLPIPLDKLGMEQAKKTAEVLAECCKGVEGIYTSIIVRAVQSAQEIASCMGTTLLPVGWLVDFNVGDMAGESITDAVVKTIHGYIQKPDKIVPGGECYNDFLDRTVPELKKVVEDHKVWIVVTHGRVMTLLNALCVAKGGKPKTEDLLNKPPVAPSGIMIVGSDWTIHYSTPKDKDGASRVS